MGQRCNLFLKETCHPTTRINHCGRIGRPWPRKSTWGPTAFPKHRCSGLDGLLNLIQTESKHFKADPNKAWDKYKRHFFGFEFEKQVQNIKAGKHGPHFQRNIPQVRGLFMLVFSGQSCMIFILLNLTHFCCTSGRFAFVTKCTWNAPFFGES